MGLFELVFGGRLDVTPLIAAPPPGVVWRRVRPGPSHPVLAKLATRNGVSRTARGVLRYRAGQHYIVERKGGERSVVSRPVFERTYRALPDGSYEKRPDIEYRYFTLPYDAIIATPEGRQRAAAGDWIMQGVEGELWPLSPDKAAAIYMLSSSLAPHPA